MKYFPLEIKKNYDATNIEYFENPSCPISLRSELREI